MPEMPSWCVRGSRGKCRLRIDHFRERKTGPCYPLAVVVCSGHELAFTLYPPGHVPYGRVAVAPVGSGGEMIAEPGSEGSTSARWAWGMTVFAAAMDAAHAVAWPRGSPWQDRRRWRTQGRHLEVAARLVAVGAGIGARKREQVARLLGVALLVISSAAESYRNAVGYRARAVAVLDVVAELYRADSVGDRLQAAGSAVGLWGAPSRWDPGGEAFRPTLRRLLQERRS